MEYVATTLGTYMDTICAQNADREAIVFPPESTVWTYKQFQNLYNRLAKGMLAAGIRKGDFVGVLALNSPIWLALQIAAAKIGCVMVCLNTGYTANELQYVLNHSEVSLLFLTSGNRKNRFIDRLRELCPEMDGCKGSELAAEKLPLLKKLIMLDSEHFSGTDTLRNFIEAGKEISDEALAEAEAQVSPQDIATIQYTSGTTGNPKAVLSSHFGIVNNALVSGEWLDYCRNDRLLLCLPFFHVIGYVLSAVAGLFQGAALIIAERFETETILQYLEEEACTVFNGVPTMFTYLLNHENLKGYNLSALTKGFIAGSCCSRELMLNIVYTLGISGVCNVYGQTEAIAITQTRASDDLAHRIASIGKPLPGVQAKIVDVVTGGNVPANAKGELCIKSVYLMMGYYKDPAATDKAVDKDGWLHTGDLAFMDDKGYLSIIGRIKDMIIRGGENVSPAEIENSLRLFDGIEDAAVVAVPDEMLGEEVFAFLIKSPEADIRTDELKDFLSGHIARYKIPKYFAFVPEFPVTSSGKVRKFALKETAVRDYLPEKGKKVLTAKTV